MKKTTIMLTLLLEKVLESDIKKITIMLTLLLEERVRLSVSD